MRGLLMGLGIFLCLLAIGLWIGWGVGHWFLAKDTLRVLNRAQVAAEAKDMYGYITMLREEMEERGMIKGHAALIFKTPLNNMKLIYQTVLRTQERLEAIKDISPSETTYQVALDDLRGVLRELDLCTGGWFWAHHWWWITLSFFILIVGIILFLSASGWE